MGVVTCSVVGCDRLSLPNRAGLVGAPPVVAGDRPFDRVPPLLTLRNGETGVG